MEVLQQEIMYLKLFWLQNLPEYLSGAFNSILIARNQTLACSASCSYWHRSTEQPDKMFSNMMMTFKICENLCPSTSSQYLRAEI